LDYNAFTEGVRPGGVNNTPQAMILICFLLKKAGQPVTFEQLNDALQKESLINYFEFAQSFESLVASGHIISDERNGVKYYSPSPLAIETADELESSLPLSVRERSADALANILLLIRRERENKVSVKKLENGFDVTLTITDPTGDLLKITAFMPTEKECETIKQNFINDPMLIYKGVYALLTRDIDTVGKLKPSEQNLFD